MKRYMQENKKACGKMAKEVGIFGENMKKAVEDVNTEVDGAIVEMADLQPVLNTLSEFPSVIESMSKAIESLSNQVTYISENNDKSYDLMQKAAKVQVEQAKVIDEFMAQPAGKKGKVAMPEMQKAGNVPDGQVVVTPEQSKHVYSVLLKATKDGDTTAGQVISAFESCGKNLNRLNAYQKQYINELMTKEAH